MQATDVEGKNIVLTGKFATLKRAEAEVALTALGARVSDSISKTTDILFAGDKAGSKLAKAEQLGVAVHDEATLAALLAGASAAARPAPAERAALAEVQPVASATPAASATPVAGFAGKIVALTGTFTTMTRAEAQKRLTDAGATVGSGVTKATDILIYGDNAGSKLDKASGQGVALMTEAEMVATLTAGGAGLAGASERLVEAAAGATEMSKVVAELRAFVQALKQRKDITVEQATLGRKAGKSKLDPLRAQKVPAELVELYAEVDGVHIEWRFTEPPGQGCMRIPAVSQWTRFTADDHHYMNFGDEYEALLLDEITPEGSTYLVRRKGKGAPARIIFASAAEGADGILAAGSIVDYLRKAMHSGFVPYWPRCFTPSPNVSYAEQELAVERFRAAPVAPGKLVVGGRVQFGYFAEGGRGEVLALLEVPASDATEFTGTRFVEVRADEGSVAWIPQKSLKAWSKTDAYERLRAPGLALVREDGGIDEQLAELARAVGPLSYLSANEPLGMLPSNARRAAGLLAARPLADAVTLVLALDDAVRRAKLTRGERRPLEQTGREFDPVELSRFRWTYTISHLLDGLHAGLVVLAHHASARRGVPGAALLDAALVEQLARNPGAAELHDRCTRATPLPAPRWGFQQPQHATLGLPPGAVVWAGSGY